MNYIDKLNKLKNNLDGLEDKSKDELIEFITLIINMGIAREEGNKYADELMEIVHKSEVFKWQEVMVKVTSKISEKLYDQEELIGFKFDDFIEKLKNGELKIVKGE